MSSIDDNTNGAEQMRYHRNSPEECGRAVRLVCSYAHDADDARELCTVLGLNPQDGRRPETSRTPNLRGRRVEPEQVRTVIRLGQTDISRKPSPACRGFAPALKGRASARDLQ